MFIKHEIIFSMIFAIIYSNVSKWLNALKCSINYFINFILFLILFFIACDLNSRSATLKPIDGIDIIVIAKRPLLMKSVKMPSPLMCLVECMLDCQCFMTIFDGKNCELYPKIAKDYFIKSPTMIGKMNYKKEMINSEPMYIINGKYLI